MMKISARKAQFLPFMTIMMHRPVASLVSKTLSSDIMKLQNPSLLAEVEEPSAVFEVRNPADPTEIVGYAPSMGASDTKNAIDKSFRVLPRWRDGTTAKERAELLTKWSQLIQQNSDDLVKIMTLESGKIGSEGRSEVAYGTSFLDYYASEAIRPTSAGGGFLSPTPFAEADGRPRGQVMAMHQAVGVAAAITPWNFPIAMITRKVAPALAVGCTSIVKPSEFTPLTAIALRNLAREAGLPEDVFQVLTCDRENASIVGTELCTNPDVHKVSFTGSVPVGKILMKLCSSTVKRVSLELGGNAPFVVFDDADLDQAVDAAVASKFRNAGQTCVCADRFLVHASVHDMFVDKMAQKVAEFRVGPGLDPSTTMGPLISQTAVAGIEAKVGEAIQDGAQCVVGGFRLSDLGPNFYNPTVLTDVSPSSRIWHTETFGPVAPIVRFTTDDEALALANDSRVGLAGYFCTRNLSRAFSFSRELECGLVGVNAGIISTATAPFGGVKESGVGREGSALGLAEYLETKYVFMNY